MPRACPTRRRDILKRHCFHLFRTLTYQRPKRAKRFCCLGAGLSRGWVGLGWVGLGWVGLGWVGSGRVGLWVGLGSAVLRITLRAQQMIEYPREPRCWAKAARRYPGARYSSGPPCHVEVVADLVSPLFDALDLVLREGRQ